MISYLESTPVVKYFLPRKGARLTAGQREFVCRALAEFDPDTLTALDAQSIVEAFSEVGIKPGAELSDVMESAGFCSRKISELVQSRYRVWMPK